MVLKRNRGSKQAAPPQAVAQEWDEHSHEPVVHSHRHAHVTHHKRSLTGQFEHLVSDHDHEHDHAGLTHSHTAHKNIVAEHQDEAHVHDHGEAIKPQRASRTTTAPKKAAAKKAPGKKTTKKAAKKSAKRSG
jgi:hypothetical protein